SPSTPPRAWSRAASGTSSSPRASTRSSSTSCAIPDASSRVRRSPSPCGDWTSTPRATSWTSTSATCAARSTAQGTRGCSTRCAAPGTCCGRTRTDVRRPLSIHTRLTLWYTGVLLATLVVVSVVGYSLLAWNLAQDVDQSLLTVAEVVRDQSAGADADTPVERTLRDLLGADGLAQFFQVIDPAGRPRVRSPRLPGRAPLPLSPIARANAAHGRATFETLRFERGHDVRVLTLPVIRDGALVEVVQVGMSLAQRERTLRRYFQSLLVLVPLAVARAASRRSNASAASPRTCSRSHAPRPCPSRGATASTWRRSRWTCSTWARGSRRGRAWRCG